MPNRSRRVVVVAPPAHERVAGRGVMMDVLAELLSERGLPLETWDVGESD